MNTETTGLMEPFIQSAIETFRIMVHVKVTAEEAPSHEIAQTIDYSGMIELSGEIEGRVTMRYSDTTARAVASAFLGEKDVPVTLVADVVGELVNIISSYAKKGIPDLEYRISLPVVVFGAGHLIATRGGDRKMAAHFTSPLGQFSLEVCFDRQPWHANQPWA